MPSYLSFFTSTTCVVRSSDCSVYGPDPAEFASSQLFAPSLSSVVPPFFFTTFELRIASDGLVTMAGSCSEGVFVDSVTVLSSTLVTVIPVIRKLALESVIPATRSRENTTSSAVTGVPSENVRPSWIVKVNSVASAFCFMVARSGFGVVESAPWKVSSVSYTACSTMLPVGT